jgi:hypothetical protein
MVGKIGSAENASMLLSIDLLTSDFLESMPGILRRFIPRDNRPGQAFSACHFPHLSGEVNGSPLHFRLPGAQSARINGLSGMYFSGPAATIVRGRDELQWIQEEQAFPISERR